MLYRRYIPIINVHPYNRFISIHVQRRVVGLGVILVGWDVDELPKQIQVSIGDERKRSFDVASGVHH